MAKKLASKITNELIEDTVIKEQKLNIDEFSDSWKGRTFILHPEQSEIAQKLNLKKAGEFAIKTR
jgi:RNA polymerase subunit RPABC4/transcription elongation factor Spt4